MRQLKITRSITNREIMSLDKYLQEIGNEELLSPDEEVELAQKIRHGDRKALERLTRANLRFVVSVAKQYQSQGIGLPDLINEGNLGLLKAAERFDETRGFKFISYAVWWIRQSILQAITSQGRLIRLPANQLGTVNKIARIFTKFEQEHERVPSVSEIAKETGLSEEHIEEALDVSTRHVSMDSTYKDEDGTTLLDVLPATNTPSSDKLLMDESLRDEIQRALQELPDREQEVLKAYFGIDQREHTLEEIGDIYGLSRERVRQIKEKGIRHLRLTAHSRSLRSYLG